MNNNVRALWTSENNIKSNCNKSNLYMWVSEYHNKVKTEYQHPFENPYEALLCPIVTSSFLTSYMSSMFSMLSLNWSTISWKLQDQMKANFTTSCRNESRKFGLLHNHGSITDEFTNAHHRPHTISISECRPQNKSLSVSVWCESIVCRHRPKATQKDS